MEVVATTDEVTLSIETENDPIIEDAEVQPTTLVSTEVAEVEAQAVNDSEVTPSETKSIHISLSRWLHNANLILVGNEVSEATDESIAIFVGQQILDIPQPTSLQEIESHLKKEFDGFFKFSSSEFNLENITENLLYYATSPSCANREKFVQGILDMDPTDQEYLMQVIKFYSNQESYEDYEEVTEFDDADTAYGTTGTKNCSQCAKKDDIIAQLRKKLAENLDDDEDMESAGKEAEKADAKKDSASKIAELTDSLNNLSEELESVNQKLLDADEELIKKEIIIGKLESEKKENEKKAAEALSSNARLSEQLRAAQEQLDASRSKIERVDIIDAQLENMRNKVYGHAQTIEQLKAEQAAHTNTYAKLVNTEKELIAARQLCEQLEELRATCDDSFNRIDQLNQKLAESEDENFRLKNEKQRLEKENKDHVFHHQLLEEELTLANERLHNLETAGGVGVAVHELNPVLMTELKNLRNETKELRAKLLRSSIEECEKLQKELAEERLLSAALHGKWMFMKDAHDVLKQKLESARGFAGSQLVDENELREIRKQYEIELIRLRGKLHDAEIKIQSMVAKQAGANEALNGEAAKKYEYEIVDLKSKLADANNKISDLMDTIHLKETILNSSKEEGLIATRRAHEIEIKSLRAALADAQSRVNDLTVANKVQEAVLNGSVAEHNESRKHFEAEIASMRAVILESQSKINELSIINKVQESALASNQEDIANVKNQYEIETNHLKAAYSEAKAKIAELNEALKALGSAKTFHEEELRARKILEDEIVGLKVSLQASQSKTNELLVSNKVLDSALVVAKDDLSKYKELSQQEIIHLKAALSSAQIKVNELSVSNKVNENSSKLNEATVIRLRNELAEYKKQSDLELRSTKKALQDAQTKIHELIQDQIRRETQTKQSGGDPDLVPAIKGHFESEVNQLKMSLQAAQEKINDLSVVIKVQEHALTTAREELAIAKHQHDVDISQSKFNIEIYQNKIKVLEDSIRRQEDSLKSSLNFQGDQNSDASSVAQDTGRRYFENEAARLRISLAEAESKVEHLMLAANEKERAFEELSVHNKINENIIAGSKSNLDELKARTAAEIAILQAQLTATQNNLNDSLVSNKVQENILVELKAELGSIKKNWEYEAASYRQKISELTATIEELTEANRRLEMEKNTIFVDLELKRLKNALAEAHSQEEALRRENIELHGKACDLKADVESKDALIVSLRENLVSTTSQNGDVYSKLRNELKSLRAQYNDLSVKSNVNEQLLAATKDELESLRSNYKLEVEKANAEVELNKAQLDSLTDSLKKQEETVAQLTSELTSSREEIESQKKTIDALSAANKTLASDFASLKEVHELAESKPHHSSHHQRKHTGDIPTDGTTATKHLRRGSKGLSKTDDGEEDDDDQFGTLPIYDFQVVQLQTSLAESKDKAEKLNQELEQKDKIISELACHKKILESLLETTKENLAEINTRSAAEISSLKAHNEEAEKEYLDLNVRMHVVEERNMRLAADLDKANQDLSVANQMLKESEASIADLTASITVLQEKVQTLTLQQAQSPRPPSQNAEVKKESNGSQSNEEIQNLKAALQEKLIRISELSETVRLYGNTIADLKNRSAADNEQASATVADLQTKIIDLAASKIKVEKDLFKSLDDLRDLRAKLDRETVISSQAVRLQAKIDESEKELLLAKSEISSLREKVESLENANKSSENKQIADVKIKVNELSVQLAEKEAELLKSKTALDAALKVQADSAKKHQEEISKLNEQHEIDLKNNAISVRDVLQARTEKYLHEVTEQKEALIRELDAVKAELLAAQSVHVLSEESPEGLQASSDFEQGQASESQSSKIYSGDITVQLPELHFEGTDGIELDEVRKQLEEANVTIEELRRELQSLKDEREAFAKARKGLEDELLAQKGILSEVSQRGKDEAQVKDAQLATTKKELDAALQIAAELSQKEAALAQTQRELEESLKTREELLKKHDDEIKELKKQHEIDIQNNAVTVRDHVKAKVENYLNEITEEKEALSQELESVKGQLVAAQSVISLHGESNESEEEAKKRIEELTRTVQNLVDEKENFLRSKQDLEDELSTTKGKLTDARQHVQSLSEEAVANEARLATIKKELEDAIHAHEAFVKEHSETELQLKTQYNIELQNEALALRELEQAKKMFEMESHHLKDRLHQAQEDAKHLAEINRAIEDNLRSCKEEVSVMRVKHEIDVQATKSALQDAQYKVADLQQALDRQRDEAATNRKDLEAALQQLALAEVQHKTEVESLSANLREQINAKVEEYIKGLQDENDKLHHNLRVEQTEVTIRIDGTYEMSALIFLGCYLESQVELVERRSGALDSHAEILQQRPISSSTACSISSLFTVSREHQQHLCVNHHSNSTERGHC